MYATPYISSTKDKTELLAKFANLGNLGIGMANMSDLRIVVFLLNGVTKVAMLLLSVTNTDRYRNMKADMFQQFSFSDSTDHTQRKSQAGLGGGDAYSVISGWNLNQQIKHRVWWPFWDGILMKKYGEKTSMRLLDLKRITENEGLAAITSHWQGCADPEAMRVRRESVDVWEGVDCYWSDGFGKMFVK